MPKRTKQVQGEILHEIKLRTARTGRREVSIEDLETIMEDVGIEQPTTRKYVSKLIELDQLKRVEGGFELTNKGKAEGVIIIRVSPLHNRDAVIKGLEAALQQFKPLVALEVEA